MQQRAEIPIAAAVGARVPSVLDLAVDSQINLPQADHTFLPSTGSSLLLVI